MSIPLVIFGLNDMGELAHYYFTNDTEYTVVAFTLDREYITETSFCGLPVIPFDELEERYPPSSCHLFIALGYSKINHIRKEKYLAAKSLGYTLASYISPRATILNQDRIGDNCFIFEDNTIQPFVTIGNNVVLWSGNHIGHHSTIQDHVFITSHVVISGGVTIGEQCFIGVNATLRDHITVGARCVVGAGVLLLGDAESDGLYIGAATERSAVPSSRIRKI